jgi:hypothetical protein
LLIVVAFLWFKLGQNRNRKNRLISSMKMLPPEETRMERPDGGERRMTCPLSITGLSSIASNVAQATRRFNSEV